MEFVQTFKYYHSVGVSMVGNNPTSETVRPLKRDAGINVLDNRTRRGLTQTDVDTRLADAPSTHLVRKVAHGYEPKCVGPREKVVRYDVRVVSNDKTWAFRLDSDTPVMTCPVLDSTGQTVSELTLTFVSKDHSRMDKEGRDAHVLISERIKATGQVIGWASARSLALKVTLASKPSVVPAQYKYTLTACRIVARNGQDGLDVGANPIHTWNVRRPSIYNRAGAIKAGFIPAPQAPAYTGRPQFVKFTGVDYDVDGIAIDYKRFIGRVPPMYAGDN